MEKPGHFSAAINNALFKPSIGGSSGGLFGDPFNVIGGFITGKYARGSTFTPGGMALVGEQGPELVHLPRGSQVTPNHMLGQGGSSGRSGQNVHVTSEVQVSVDPKTGNLKAFVVNESAKVSEKAVEKFAGSNAFMLHTRGAVQDLKKRGMLR